MMITAKHIGALRNVRRSAARWTMSIGVALMAVMVVLVAFSTVSPAVKLSYDSTALLVCGTTCPTWHDADVEAIMNQFITPSRPPAPGQSLTPVAVTTPSEAWPITGIFRLLGLLLGDPSFFGPGGAAWPDEPWWKLSGLFDMTTNQSVRAGVTDLEQAMAAHGNDDLVIYGYSQGAVIVNLKKRKLAEQYPAGTTAPDIDFVLGGDFSVPNGGIHARFPGLYIPILDWSFDGPEPTDTPFDTVVITRQYDGVSDFPLYPLNLIADLNALLGFLYVHSFPFDVSLADETSAPTVSTDPTGKASYYFFETQNLPLFGPLRTLGVPEALIDVAEPFFRVLVELGYDRTIPAWKPTPARLIPRFDAVKVITDLVYAIGDGINNALALVGVPQLPNTRTSATPAAPLTETSTVDISNEGTSKDTLIHTEQAMSTGTAIDSREALRHNATASTKTVTATAEVDASSENAATELVTETDNEPPTSPNVTETVTPTPEPSVEVAEERPDRSDSEGDELARGTAAAGAEASTDAPSSTGSSAATSSSSGGGSDGDGDGS